MHGGGVLHVRVRVGMRQLGVVVLRVGSVLLRWVALDGPVWWAGILVLMLVGEDVLRGEHLARIVTRRSAGCVGSRLIIDIGSIEAVVLPRAVVCL